MTRRLINFTAGEASALLHRLTSDALAENDKDAQAIDARCAEFIETLGTSQPFVCLHHEDPLRSFDLDILTDAIEGSTWIAVNDATPQAKTAARRTLKHAAWKICEAFGKAPDYIEVPRG